MRTISRCLLLAALVLPMTTGCGSSGPEGADPSPPRDAAVGLLTEADMPSPVSEHFDEDRRPTRLTGQGDDDCLGNEYDALLPASGHVHVRKFESHVAGEKGPWLIESAAFGLADGAGLDTVEAAARDCWSREQDVTVRELDLGEGRFGYAVTSPDGTVDGARGYRALGSDTLAQVSILVAPASADVTAELERLLDRLS